MLLIRPRLIIIGWPVRHFDAHNEFPFVHFTFARCRFGPFLKPVLIPSRAVWHAALGVPGHDVTRGRIVDADALARPEDALIVLRNDLDEAHPLLGGGFAVLTTLPPRVSRPGHGAFRLFRGLSW